MCKHEVMSQSEQVSYRKGFILSNKLHRPVKGDSFLLFLLGTHGLHWAVLSTSRERNKEETPLL